MANYKSPTYISSNINIHSQLVKTLIIIFFFMNVCSSQPVINEANNQQTDNSQKVDSTRVPSATQEQQILQTQDMQQFYSKNNISGPRSHFAFQITHQFQQFHFHLGFDHIIHFLVRIYVLKDNAYKLIQNVDQQPALHVIVYQNNHKVIADKIFYFEDAITVNGKKDSTYMIRFYSPTHKLVLVNHNNFIQGYAFQSKIKSQKIKTIDTKISNTQNKLNEIFKKLKTTHWIQLQQRSSLTRKFQKFSNFQIVQIAVIIALCLLQMKLISKLFKNNIII